LLKTHFDSRITSSMSAKYRSKNNYFSLVVSLGIAAIALPLLTLAIKNLDQSYKNTKASADDFLQSEGSDLLYKGNKIVLRGVNFDNIPAMGAGIGTNNIDSINIKEEDYAKLAEFGGNHVRLGTSYTWYEQNKNKYFEKIDQQISWAKKHGIWVTLLTFTNPDGNDGCYEGYSEYCSIWTNTNYQKQLLDFWLDITNHYKNEPAVAGYDLVNEPTPPGPNWCETWFNLAQKWRNQIAAVSPNQLVFIEACSDPTFDRIFKEADNTTKAKNVVYEVHDYDPMAITHPGYNATNISNAYPGNAKAWVNGVEKTMYFDKTTFAGSRYPDYSTAKAYSVNWARQNNVPIYIGEWGAQGWVPGYAQFIKDKAEIYTDLKINHAYYTWRHDVNTGWKWGLFPKTGGFEALDAAKINAAKVAFANSFRPNFNTTSQTTQPTAAPTMSSTPRLTNTPTPIVTPQPTRTPTPHPTATPSPRPTSTPTITRLPSQSPLATRTPFPRTPRLTSTPRITSTPISTIRPTPQYNWWSRDWFKRWWRSRWWWRD
jgi:hypothetical protein